MDFHVMTALQDMTTSELDRVVSAARMLQERIDDNDLEIAPLDADSPLWPSDPRDK